MKRKSKIVRIVLPLACMAVLSAVLLLTTAAIRGSVWGALDEPVTGLPTIASVSPLDASSIGDTAVSALDGCYDVNGTLIAYRVEMSANGFNSAVPIQLAVTVSADGTVLRGIEVLSQKETEYYGARIAESGFQSRFSDRNLPVYLTGQGGRGAHVDGLSGATISSQAVVDAINQAADIVRTLGGE